jgi:signal transduction histidine kinase
MMAKHFSVDARAMLTWGRESIKDHTTAVLELVKNSYDANATVVVVQINASLYATGGAHIRVSDNGVGMTLDEVETNWLRLGYSAKLEERFTPRGRRKTGEKGVGRISADRLGSVLELRSQARGSAATGLRVDWREFEKPGRDIQTVPVSELDDLAFIVPQPTKRDAKSGEYADPPHGHPNGLTQTGTELLIRDLRQTWDADDLQELRRLLSLLTPPFEHVDDFQIRLESDVDPTCSGVVTSPLIASAAIEGHFRLLPNGEVNIRLVHRASGSSRRRVERKTRVAFERLVHPKVKPNTNDSPTDSARRLGPVSAQLFFYPQKAETVRGLDLDLSELREFLRMNAGVRVYRDGIRVPPFGDSGKPEGDWLALGDRKARNPAGPNRPDFRVSPYQLVGAVMIGRDSNPKLIDTSGREGLVAGEALAVLKSFLIGCLTRLETKYHELFTENGENGQQPLPSPRDTVGELKVQLSDLADTIRRAEVKLPAPASKELERVVEQLATTTDKLKKAERTFEELGSQAATSRTLATIGIASATFGHETQRGLDSLRATLNAAHLLLKNGEAADAVMGELEKAIGESERVSAWGAFALGRVRRDKRVRRIHDVAKLVGDILDEIGPAMDASSITLSRDLRPVRARVFAMDVECVVINLLTNAYYFTKQSHRDRRVSAQVRAKSWQGRRGFELTVADSGPGVPKDIQSRIWDPLFTTKTDDGGKSIGTGLGLALVNAVVQDTEGSRTIEKDPRLLGARFVVWLPDAGD